MEYVTVRQLADELQISKVSINNRIDKLNLRDQLIKSGNRHLIPADTAELIKESFRTNRKTEPPQPDTQTTVIEILSEQLKQKDAQIQSLMNQLELLQSQNSDLLKMQRESHYLLAKSMGIDEEQEPVNADTVTDPDENEPQTAETTSKKKGFWSRFFG